MLRCKYLLEDRQIGTLEIIIATPTIILQLQIPKPDIWSTSMATDHVYLSEIKDDATGYISMIFLFQNSNNKKPFQHLNKRLLRRENRICGI
jgi:hypothetical protein